LRQPSKLIVLREPIAPAALPPANNLSISHDEKSHTFFAIASGDKPATDPVAVAPICKAQLLAVGMWPPVYSIENVWTRWLLSDGQFWSAGASEAVHQTAILSRYRRLLAAYSAHELEVGIAVDAAWTGLLNE
jgi:hypothetical protein